MGRPTWARPRTGTLAEYLVPVNADVHELDAIFVDGYDAVLSPLGTKGIAELGLCGVAPAYRERYMACNGKAHARVAYHSRPGSY